MGMAQNTAVRTIRVAMILPDLKDQKDAWGDERLPNPIDGETNLDLVGSYYVKDFSQRCPRHLFDVVKTARDINDEEAESGRPSTEFRANLTCVRCGIIQQWGGTLTKTDSHRIDPRPLRHKNLAAQMVRNHQSFGRVMSDWRVYDADEQRVGSIGWAAGPRGRAYFVGRLSSWPEGQTVEGRTPAAVLKKIAAVVPS
jgi:hypothetical protein